MSSIVELDRISAVERDEFLGNHINPTKSRNSQMIDKLIIHLTAAGLDIDSAKPTWAKFGLKWKEDKLDNRHAIRLFSKDGSLHLAVRGRGRYAYRLIVNPARNFKSFQDLVEFIECAVPKDYLRACNISELHFAVDYNVPFSEILKGLNWGAKRSWHKWGDRLNTTNGYMFGAGDEVLVIYDKYQEQNRKKKNKLVFPDPTTRIELRLKDKELITKSFYSLKVSLKKCFSLPNQCWPMSNIELNKIELLPQEQVFNFDHIKFERLCNHLDLKGFFQTKRILNKSGNFARTYNRYMTLKQPYPFPRVVLKDSVLNFLDAGSASGSLGHK